MPKRESPASTNRNGYGLEFGNHFGGHDVAILIALQICVTVAAGSDSTQQAFFYLCFVFVGVLPVFATMVTALLVVYLMLSSQQVGGDQDSAVRKSIFLLFAGQFFLAITSFVSQAATAIKSAVTNTVSSVIDRPQFIVVGVSLVIAGAWFEHNPLIFAETVQFLWSYVLVPVWDAVLLVFSFVVFIIDAFIPLWNIMMWTIVPPFRGFVSILWTLTDACLLEAFKRLLVGFGEFMGLFLEAITRWALVDGMHTALPDLIPAFDRAAQMIVAGKELVGCSCESLSFALSMVTIPFGTVGVNNMFNGLRGFVARPIAVVQRGLVTGVVGSQWVTPGIVSALANATNTLPAIAHTLTKAVHDRASPDFTPVFDTMINTVVYSGVAMDQGIQGSIDVLKFIASSPENNLKFSLNPQNRTLGSEWPPLFEAMAIWSTRLPRVAEFAFGIAFNVTNYNKIETWSTRKLFSEVVLGINVTSEVARSLLKGSAAPFMGGHHPDCRSRFSSASDIAHCEANANDFKTGGLADIFMTTALAILSTAQWVYDVILQSIFGFVSIGEAGSRAGRTYAWGALVQSLNADYVARIFIPWEMAAIQWGSALGYARGGPSGFPQSDKSDPIGCFAQEGLMMANILANNSLTVLYDVFTATSFDNFLERSDALLVPVAAQGYSLARCPGLLFQSFYDIVAPNACSSRFVANVPPSAAQSGTFGTPHEMTLYPLVTRQEQCISSKNPCLRFAAHEIVLEFERVCGPVSTIQFSKTLTNVPGVAMPPPTTTWDATARCTVMAAKLQAAYEETCYRTPFAPDLFFCNIGYTVETIVRGFVDYYYSLAHLTLKTFETFANPSSLLKLKFPREEWDLLACDLQKLIANVVAVFLSLMTSAIDTIVALFSTSRNAAAAQIRSEVETLVADVFFSAASIATLPVNITGSVIENFLVMWDTDVTAGQSSSSSTAGARAIPSLASIGSPIANVETSSGNFLISVVIDAIDAVFVWIVGLFESILRLCEAASDNPFTLEMCTTSNHGDNPMRGLICFLGDAVALTRAIRGMLVDIILLIYQLIRFLVGLIGLGIAGDSSALFIHTMLNSLHELWNNFVHMANALGHAISAILLQIPGIGQLVRDYNASICPAVAIIQTAFSDLVSVVNSICNAHITIPVIHKDIYLFHWLIAGGRCPYFASTPVATCTITIPTTTPQPEIVPQACYTSATCSASATCEMPNGSMQFCSQCGPLGPFPTSQAATCNTESYTCVCGPLPTQRTACTVPTLQANCGGPTSTATCAIVTQFKGQALGSVPCRACGTNGTYLGCATVQGDHDGESCVCSLSNSTFMDSAASFGRECMASPIGSACSPFSATVALALSPNRGLPFITGLNNTRLGPGDIHLVDAAFGCDATVPGIGRCANTMGLYFDKTCVCQPAAQIGPTTPPQGVRAHESMNLRAHKEKHNHMRSSYLEDAGAAGAAMAAAAPTTSETATATTHSPSRKLMEPLLREAGACSSPDACTSPFALCDFVPGGATRSCGECPAAYRVCNAHVGRCICDMTMEMPATPPLRLDEWIMPDVTRDDVWPIVSAGPWVGISVCSDVGRSVTFKPFYNDTIANMTVLERAVFRECLRLRAWALYAASATRLPVPSDLFHNYLTALEFAVDLSSTAYATMRAMSAENNSLLHELVVDRVRRGKDPMLALQLASDWRALAEAIAGSQAWEEVVQNATATLPPRAARVIMSLAHIVSAFGQMLVQHGPALVTALPQLRQDVSAAYDTVLRRNASSPNQQPREQSTLRHEATEAGFDDLVQTLRSNLHAKAANAVDGTLTPLRTRGRELLGFGSWISQEVNDCALLAAVKDVAVIIGRVLKGYYGTVFVQQAKAFAAFNMTTRATAATSMQVATVREFFAVDEIQGMFKKLINGEVTTRSVLDALLFFFKCDVETVTLGTVNRGLFKSTKLVFFMLIVVTFVAYFAFMKSMFVLLIPMGLFAPLALHAAYDYSPFCFPLIPGRFFDDLLNIIAVFRPVNRQLHAVHLARVWVAQNLSTTVCAQPPYNFAHAGANIAFMARSNETDLASSVYSQNLFPAYELAHTTDDTFQACNMGTAPRAFGHASFYFSGILAALSAVVQFVILLNLLVLCITSATLAVTTLRTHGISIGMFERQRAAAAAAARG